MNQQQQQQQPQPQQLQQQQQQHPGGGPNLGANPLVRPAGPSLVVPTPTKSSTSPSSSSSTAGVGNPMSPSTVTGTAAVGPMLSRGGMTTRARAMGGGSSFDKQSIVYMVLLSVQFGLQPILTRRFTPQGITRSTVVLAQEMTKLVLAGVMLYMTTNGAPIRAGVLRGWTVSDWIQVAGIPAALYAIQNVASLKAYQNLDALTFNVLNQTKTLSAALCCYLIMGKRQSKLQVVALLLLLLAALVMEKLVPVNDLLNYTTSSPLLSWEYWKDWSSSSSDDNTSRRTTTSTSSVSNTGSNRRDSGGTANAKSNNSNDGGSESDSQVQSLVAAAANASTAALTGDGVYWDAHRFTMGVGPILLASLISGLAGALSQRTMQRGGGVGRNAYLYSMELCAASTLLLLASWIVSADGKQVWERGFFAGWTAQTWIPIFTNSLGGILVGLVTKYAGSVRKGFALIFGILLSGFIQAVFLSRSSSFEQHNDMGVSKEQWLGGILAIVSLYLHATNPPQPIAAKPIKQD